ncbi:glycosyltransferase [Gynuella sp.]|uniref:glycosyltransferase n=1 Tax=Gynuella sp. TaxID=2969146 RepID=UPI003D11BE7B
MPHTRDPELSVKIAYLAPEIPALSATFVYNEILCLQHLGTEVVPFSIHRPKAEASESAVQDLKSVTRYLYERTKTKVAIAHLRLLLTYPGAYIKGFGTLIKDMISLRLLTRGALGLAYRFFFAAALADELRRVRAQHLHVHFAHVPTDVAMYAAVLAGISFSVTAHANDLFERGWLLKEKVRRSAFFATISEFNVRFLKDKGADMSRVTVVRCGVDDEQFLAPARAESLHATPVIGVIGRLVEKKGIDTLIEAISLLKQRGHIVELQIAGSGPLEAFFRQRVDQLGIADNVTFLGAIAHDQVADFLRSLDLFVLPCKQDSNGDMDGIPVVLMEAMLSGVPVISTKISGIPELVIHNETGLLAEPDDAESLAGAVEKFLQQPALGQQLSSQAVHIVQNEFSLSANARKLNHLFHQVVVRR